MKRLTQSFTGCGANARLGNPRGKTKSSAVPLTDAERDTMGGPWPWN